MSGILPFTALKWSGTEFLYSIHVYFTTPPQNPVYSIILRLFTALKPLNYEQIGEIHTLLCFIKIKESLIVYKYSTKIHYLLANMRNTTDFAPPLLFTSLLHSIL